MSDEHGGLGEQPNQEQTLIEKLAVLIPLLLLGLQAKGAKLGLSYGGGTKTADKEEC